MLGYSQSLSIIILSPRFNCSAGGQCHCCIMSSRGRSINRPAAPHRRSPAASQGADSVIKKIRAVTFCIAGDDDFASKETHAEYKEKLASDFLSLGKQTGDDTEQIFLLQEVGPKWKARLERRLQGHHIHWNSSLAVAVPKTWKVLSMEMTPYWGEVVSSKDDPERQFRHGRRFLCVHAVDPRGDPWWIACMHIVSGSHTQEEANSHLIFGDHQIPGETPQQQLQFKQRTLSEALRQLSLKNAPMPHRRGGEASSLEASRTYQGHASGWFKTNSGQIWARTKL
jgi:hypothetical protein